MKGSEKVYPREEKYNAQNRISYHYFTHSLVGTLNLENFDTLSQNLLFSTMASNACYMWYLNIAL